jgi:hypothetical protein
MSDCGGDCGGCDSEGCGNTNGSGECYSSPYHHDCGNCHSTTDISAPSDHNVYVADSSYSNTEENENVKKSQKEGERHASTGLLYLNLKLQFCNFGETTISFVQILLISKNGQHTL